MSLLDKSKIDLHKSPFHGFSKNKVEFAEHRQYNSG